METSGVTHQKYTSHKSDATDEPEQIQNDEREKMTPT